MIPRINSRPIASTASACAAALAAILIITGCDTAPRTATPGSFSPTTLVAPGGADDILFGSISDQLQLAIATQERYSSFLMALPGVVGTGATIDNNSKAVVVVMLESISVIGVPSLLDGVKVEKVVTGVLRPWSLTSTYRPVPIGVSAGNANDCVPGTIGCVVQKNGQKYFLSANHVFARQNQATIGEEILQPSQPDLATPCSPFPPSAVVGTLADFEPVVYDGQTENLMDAAIALVDPSVEASCATPAGFYGYPGYAGTVGEPEQGRDPRVPIMKVGRTTELTRGTLRAVNVKSKVTFASGTALFVDQYLTTQNFGGPGDSGALVVIDTANKISIGMIIGGGNNGSAIVSKLVPILQRFGATLCSG